MVRPARTASEAPDDFSALCGVRFRTGIPCLREPLPSTPHSLALNAFSKIMAITGHKSLAEIETYTREARQKLLADKAIERWVQAFPDTEPASKVG